MMGNKSILVIDDSNTICKILAVCLSQEGYEPCASMMEEEPQRG